MVKFSATAMGAITPVIYNYSGTDVPTNTNFTDSGNWSGTAPVGFSTGATATAELIINKNDSTTYTIDYDQNYPTANTNDNYYELGGSTTSTTSATPVVQNKGSGAIVFNVDGGTFDSYGAVGLGQNTTINVQPNATSTLTGATSSLFETSNSFITGVGATSSAPTTINVNTGGTLQTNGTDSEAGIAYSGGSTAAADYAVINVQGGTATFKQAETQSSGNNYGIGLRVGDGYATSADSAHGTVNLSSGAVNLSGALLDGLLNITATTTTSTGTVNVTGGTWTNSGDVLLGYNPETTTATIAPITSANGSLSIGAGGTAGTFIASKTISVGASDATGTLTLSGTGVLEGSSSQGYISAVNVGTTFEYKENFNNNGTATYLDGPTDGATTYLVGKGTFNMSGGTAYIGNMTVGGVPDAGGATQASSFNWTGGTLKLSPTGTLTFNDNSTLTLASGETIGAGTLTLNGTSNGDTLQWYGTLPTLPYEIATYSSLGGTAFSSTGTGNYVGGFTLGSTLAGYTLDYNSTADAIYLDPPTTSPEPASLSALAMGGAMLLRRRSRLA